MRKLELVLLSTLFISGIGHANDTYIPLLYNLSTIFDFNPVKGPVKTLQTIVENDGKITYKINLKLNKNGCVDSLVLDNISGGYNTELKRDGTVLSGKRNNTPYFIGLTKECNILTQNDNGNVNAYSLTSDGFIKDTYYSGHKIAEHFYDKNSNMVLSEFYASGKLLSKNEIMFLNFNDKPLDYQILNTSTYSEGYTATSTCEYNAKLVPEVCQLIIQKTGEPLPKPVVMTAHTTVEFY
jgi:Uncharacterised protein family (UPF0257).